jgi:putative Mg2+ transporter-C (MgtC) family protein
MSAHLMSNPSGWLMSGELGLALLLSAAIGLERELRAKSAGLPTHALVGLGSALFMLISKYGFTDMMDVTGVSLDPSRVAAQIVSGIGFIGGGLIFVRRDAVRGLTTAATIWLTAAVGAAAGAGLWLPAVLATGGHFLAVFGLGWVSRLLPRSLTAASSLDLVYVAGVGTLSRALETASRRGFTVAGVTVDPPERPAGWEPLFVGEQAGDSAGPDVRHVRFDVSGTGRLVDLVAEIESLDGVLQVRADDANVITE